MDALRDFGAIKGIWRQKYISKPNVFNGTRMVTMIVKDTPPRFLKICGYRCRTWFKGQSLVCDLCMDPRHNSADCPDKENAKNVNSRVILPINAPLWKNAIDVTALITQLVNVQMLGVVVGLQRSLLPLRRKKILLLPLIFSLPPLLLFLRRPLFQTLILRNLLLPRNRGPSY